MKKLIIVLVLCAMAYSQAYKTDRVYNSKLMHADTLWVLGTDTAYTQLFQQSKANEKAVEISVDDTSAAGFAVDTVSLSVTLLQGYDRASLKLVKLYQSTAYTDGIVYADFGIDDCDTLNLWQRSMLPVLRYNRDTTGWYATNALDSLVTNQDASAYVQLVPDYSPWVCLMFIGLAGNNTNKPTEVIVRWYQQQGLPVYDD